MSSVTPGITPYLMFTGRAEEAMTFYTSLFRGDVVRITRYGAEEPSRQGTVMQAEFTLKGQTFLCMDSPPVHAFTFTPSISLYVDCDSDEEIERCFAELARGGTILMPLQAYPFSPKFGWVQDRFGVSWQLNRQQK